MATTWLVEKAVKPAGEWQVLAGCDTVEGARQSVRQVRPHLAKINYRVRMRREDHQ